MPFPAACTARDWLDDRPRRALRSAAWIVRARQTFCGLCCAILLLPAVAPAQDGFADGFEFRDLPAAAAPRVDFVSDKLLLFDAPGQHADLDVRVIGDDGAELPDAAITWVSSDPSNVAVVSTGARTARATALRTFGTPVSIRAEHAGLAVGSDAVAAMGVPNAGTVLIPSEAVLDVRGNRGAQHQVQLARNARTDTLVPGSIVMSGDRAGVLVRVLSVSPADAHLLITVEPALITDAFHTLDFHHEAEPLLLTVDGHADGYTVALHSVRDKHRLWHREIAKGAAAEMLRCSAGIEAALGLDLSAVHLHRELRPEASAVIRNAGLQELELGIRGSAGVDLGLALDVSGATTASGTCTLQMPDIVLPGPMLLYVITVSAVIEPSIRVSVQATSEAGAQLRGPRISRRWNASAGVRYRPDSGWARTGSTSYVEHVTGDMTMQADGALGADITAVARIEAGLSFDLGRPSTLWSENLARLDFFSVQGGPYWRYGIDAPLSWLHRDYTGPVVEAGVSADATIGLSASLFEGTLGAHLPLRIDSGLSFDVFSDQWRLHRSATVGGSIACTPDCSGLPTDGSGSVTLTAQVPVQASGTVDFLLGRDGADTLEPFASTAFDAGVGQVERVIDTALGEGRFDVFARLRLDGAVQAYTQATPLASDGPLGSFSVGPCRDNTVVDADLLQCFTDAALRACVESQHLGRPIVDVDTVSCPSAGVASLAGLQTLTALNELDLDGNAIVDLAPLAELTALTGLSLSDNQIADVSALATLTALLDLSLNDNQIADVNALGGLENLFLLSLDNNRITDVSALGRLTELFYLEIYGNDVVDVSALDGLTALRVLELSRNEIVDMSPLGALPELLYLYIEDNHITDVSPLEGLTSLTDLSLGNNQIVDVEVLANLTDLTALNLHGNQIADVDPIGSLTALTRLYLSQNRIVDVNAIGNLSELTELYLSGNRIADVTALTSLTELTDLRLGGNELGGAYTISCDSAAALVQGLSPGVVASFGCRCACGCGPRNGVSTTSCATTCANACPAPRPTEAENATPEMFGTSGAVHGAILPGATSGSGPVGAVAGGAIPQLPSAFIPVVTAGHGRNP